ncbi:hypothetical protein [Treponema sp.]|uniref:hypothetical protein n=1 Tax=Treponema sp. TaxID=166 RepID=UPI003FA31F58
MKKIVLLLYGVFGVLNVAFCAQELSTEIKPATHFAWDLKYTGHFSFKNIKIANYYEIREVIPVNINNDGKEDYLILLVPKSIIAPLSDDFEFAMEKFYRRSLVEIISTGETYRVGKTYNTLISNMAGFVTGFDGIEKVEDGIIISHSTPNGNIYWSLSMFFRYEEGELYLYKIQQVTRDRELKTQKVDRVSAQNVTIFTEDEFDID